MLGFLAVVIPFLLWLLVSDDLAFGTSRYRKLHGSSTFIVGVIGLAILARACGFAAPDNHDPGLRP